MRKQSIHECRSLPRGRWVLVVLPVVRCPHASARYGGRALRWRFVSALVIQLVLRMLQDV